MENTKRHRVLIVDDSMINRQILRDILSDRADVIEVEDGVKACDYIMEHFYDIHIVLLDLVMPRMNGFEVLEFMRKKHMTDYLPVIMISSDNDERNIERAFDLGAIDFISRPFMDRIVLRRVLTTIDLFEKQKELVRKVDKQFVADDRRIDELTGLDFKDTFFDNVQTLIRSHSRQKLWMIAIDIDHFKLFNSFFGWDHGDNYLRVLGAYLRDFVRRHGGAAGYIGGDDFAVLCPDKRMAMADIEAGMIHEMEVYHLDVAFRVKAGLYEIEDPGEDVMSIYEKSLIALESIRDDYSTHYAFYESSMGSKPTDEYAFLSDVKRGLDEGEFVYFLRPRMESEGGDVTAAEVLICWDHRKQGLLQPDRFMDLLEKSGFISMLDRRIWEDVIRRMGMAGRDGGDVLPLCISVSRADIYTMDVTGFVTSYMDAYGLDHGFLEIRITGDPDDSRVADEIGRLRESGFSVIIGDAGDYVYGEAVAASDYEKLYLLH